MRQFLSDEEIKLLIKEYQKSGNIQLRNKVADNYYFFVRKIAGKIYSKYRAAYCNVVSFEDFIQWGIFGLIDSINKYNRDDIKFKTYARCRISGSIIDAVRILLKNRSNRKNKKYFFSLENILMSEDTDYFKNSKALDKDYRYNPERLYFENLDKDLIRDFYNNNVFYNEREKSIFEDYFLKEERTIDIARKNKVSGTLICYAVKDLKNKMRRYYQDNYC